MPFHKPIFDVGEISRTNSVLVRARTQQTRIFDVIKVFFSRSQTIRDVPK